MTAKPFDSPAERTLSRAEMDRAARALRGYATKYDSLHRDIADDFRAGATALELHAEEYMTLTVKP